MGVDYKVGMYHRGWQMAHGQLFSTLLSLWVGMNLWRLYLNFIAWKMPQTGIVIGEIFTAKEGSQHILIDTHRV